MLRRLATLTLALSMSLTAFAPEASARGFASAPADRLVEIDGADAIRRPTPRLSEETKARLKKVLASRRTRNVKAFRAYALRGVYPHNYVTSGELNVWIDNDGHMCAAATMIFKSGHKKLVRQTAKDNNYIRLADVTDGALMDWILTSGLTHAEVIAIQAPMVGGPEMPVEIPENPIDWRIAEDARLRALYNEVLVQLGQNRTDSLDAAVDALTFRPDLVAKLLAA